mmetsp:Transcript_6282/g.12778  ORF Transcript_6282/g.12778 Transcript_6282/m.12778 type:complete len:232 (-) Transcript_6282:699-1394(-)
MRGLQLLVQIRMQPLRRRSDTTDPDVVSPLDELHRAVCPRGEVELFHGQVDRHRLLGPGLVAARHPRKALELADGPRYRVARAPRVFPQADVELDHLVARGPRLALEHDRSRHDRARVMRARLDRRGLERELGVGAAGVGEAEAERVQRSLSQVAVGTPGRIVHGEREVVLGQLIEPSEHRLRKPPRWVDSAQEHVGQRSTTLLAGVPAIHDRGDAAVGRGEGRQTDGGAR